MATRSKEKIGRISLEDARERMDRIAFVDARSTTAILRNPLKIAGAIYLPLKDLANGLQRLPRNQTLVTYCTCSDERTSVRAARQLKEHGFSDVYPLRGGFKSWQEAGMLVQPMAKEQIGKPRG